MEEKLFSDSFGNLSGYPRPNGDLYRSEPGQLDNGSSFNIADGETLSWARSIGFKEKIDTAQDYHAVFDRMVKARMIPVPTK